MLEKNYKKKKNKIPRYSFSNDTDCRGDLMSEGFFR